jgi:hypothetical protein
MNNPPIHIPGVGSPVSVNWNVWTGKQRVMVGGRPATTTGRRTYALPTVDGGTVEGKVSRSTLISPFPTVEVAGVKHATGPDVPVALRVLMAAPTLLVALGGLVGALVAVGALLTNLKIVRGTRTTATKALLMALTFVSAIAIWATTAVLVI